MKTRFYIVLAVVMLLALAGCGQQAPSELDEIASVESAPPTPSPTPSVPASDTDLTEATEPPQETETPFPTPRIDDSQAIETYRAFLEDNYQGLYDACFGGISGIGFIDLDCDGYREMLIFDAGASASMGVQFFDIADGQVECVSANLTPMGDAFGGGHYTKVYVNANYFEDFRLVELVETGERFFLVESGNGSLEFSYRELIRFGRDGDDVLTLTPLFYVREEYDLDTGDIVSASYRVDNKEASQEEYSSANTAFLGSILDLGLEAKGIFAWSANENLSTDTKDGFLAMADKAIELSEANFLDR